jgi:ribosomal protein L37AE/L43A
MKSLVLGLVLVTVAACSSQPTSRDSNIYDSASARTPGMLVRCESVNNTRQTCPVDARGRMVFVNQQLSENPCIIGRSWNVSNDRDEIWVDNGCRAEFQVGGSTVAAAAFGRSVICESQNNTRARCPVDTSYGVQLVRQISESGCVRGTDWGFDENGIWVDRGCRAEFVLGGEQRFTPRTATANARVVCESQNQAMNRCAADTYYGVALARQISNSTCVRGETWGYDAQGIWVTRGCRAEFVLGY